MPKFRKKPVVINATQVVEPVDIETLEGNLHAEKGSWLITGVKGEPYPCSAEVFALTYEPADTEAEHLWREVYGQPSKHEAARCVWEVTAGIIPGTAEPEFTKRFGMTSGDYESPYSSEIFTSRMTEAVHYAQQLHDPNRFNWVRVDWIWF